jgi:hypothetical protein
MRTKQIEKYLAKARHFRALADPDTNHLQATGHSTMLPARAAARAQYWEDRAAELLASGIARKKPKT